jgi:hypothetical protein
LAGEVPDLAVLAGDVLDPGQPAKIRPFWLGNNHIPTSRPRSGYSIRGKDGRLSKFRDAVAGQKERSRIKERERERERERWLKTRK